MEFINILANLMKDKSINTLDLQRDTGISESTFRNWKRGSQPTAEKIIILSKYFDISSDMLLGLKEPLELTENDKELLELFRTLPEREQIKLIGKVEDLVNKYKGE